MVDIVLHPPAPAKHLPLSASGQEVMSEMANDVLIMTDTPKEKWSLRIGDVCGC